MYQRTTLRALSSLLLSGSVVTGRVINIAERATCDSPVVWVPKGAIAAGVGATAENVQFGDIDGDGRADYLVVDDDGSVIAYRNQPGSSDDEIIWLPHGKVSAGAGHDGAGVRFADINGDGRDDYLWVSEEGKVIGYLNTAGGSDGKPIWIPQGEIATGVGARRNQVIFGDINGDGRADYLVVGENGALETWLNTDAGTGNPVWIPQGKIAAGAGAAAGARIADINGDKRDDYLWLSETGAISLFINTEGSSGSPIWVPQGEIATGVSTTREAVRFADINGDGRTDYLVLGAGGEVTAWQNEACQ
ncbi:hypothetical protein BJY04DRAFT_213591 [Aspergillus karnatakaensis]|uniref:FG-GAP repeat domain-containing protein n=1 Tax=Aspergillus karnatakaensis TaxID=1810916 RepID=UPI003CCD75C4